MAHLASTISTQGRWQEAEELQSQMVEIVLKKPSVRKFIHQPLLSNQQFSIRFRVGLCKGGIEI